MTKTMSRAAIRACADALLDKHRARMVPVDVEKLCRKRGIAISVQDLSPIETATNQKVSGAIISNEETRLIIVNEQDIPTRQRFTIAHELGHDLLHIDDDDDGRIVSFRSLKNDRERQADLFATELLMPAELVKQEHEKAFFPTVSYLAGVFDVSCTAMRYRLDELGLRYIG